MVTVVLTSCEDKVKKFDGFTQKEMEYLLAGEEAKAWERIGKVENGSALVLEDCDLENYLILVQGSLGNPKPLLYAYNPSICDSLDFCNLHPDFCQSNLTLCSENTDFCAGLDQGMLYIGSWYAKQPFIKNGSVDTLVFTINKTKESIYVSDINAQYAAFQYKNRIGASGGIITEYYQFSAPVIE